MDGLLHARLLEMDVDAFGSPAYAQSLTDGIVKSRSYFVNAADATALLATTAATAVRRHAHPVRLDYRFIEKDIAFDLPQNCKGDMGKVIYLEPHVEYLNILNALERTQIESIADVERMLPVVYAPTHDDRKAQSRATRI